MLQDRAGRYREYLPLDLLLLGAAANVTADVLTAAGSVRCRDRPSAVCGAASAGSGAACTDISTLWGQSVAACGCAGGAVYVAGGEVDPRTAQVAAGGGYPCLDSGWLVGPETGQAGGLPSGSGSGEGGRAAQGTELGEFFES